jgi:hypothetical protein
MNTKKWIGISILCAAAVCAGVWIYRAAPSIPSIPRSGPSVETSTGIAPVADVAATNTITDTAPSDNETGTRTYRNNEFGFEFQIPAYLQVGLTSIGTPPIPEVSFCADSEESCAVILDLYMEKGPPAKNIKAFQARLSPSALEMSGAQGIITRTVETDTIAITDTQADAAYIATDIPIAVLGGTDAATNPRSLLIQFLHNNILYTAAFDATGLNATTSPIEYLLSHDKFLQDFIGTFKFTK